MNNLISLDLDNLEYAKNRIAMYGELPTKAQLLGFLFEVENRMYELESAATNCLTCAGYVDEEDES